MILIRKACLACIMAISAVLFVAGCAVGPNFKKPAAPVVPGYTPTPLSTTSETTNVSGGKAQRFLEGRDIPGEWWTLFHSKPLDDLIERSLKANPDLKAAQAALLVARENVLAQRGAYYPSVNGSFSTVGAKSSTDVSPVTNTSALNYSFLHAAGQCFVRAGRFRSEPANRGVVERPGAAGAFCPGRDAYHVELKRRRRRHTRGVLAGAD